MLVRFSSPVERYADSSQIYSNTRIFYRAKGQRLEAVIVALVGLGSFFMSSHVLPYIPTILASTLVLFIGLDLLVQALWESSSFMVWGEWVTVTGTTLACSLLGFAPGIGIGLLISISLHFLLDSINSVGYACNYSGIR
jgi:MFS superfamily sulfate permease-like transporter